VALSNRDRIGQMFELVAPALDSFITRVLGPELPDGASWTSLVALRDSEKGIAGKAYEPLDPQVQLRLLTENIPNQLKKGWFPFDGHLSPAQRNWASELREVRNQWAHNASFSDDDAYRALDTAERLLGAIAAADVAVEVAAIRLNLRRVTAEKDDKKAIKNAVVQTGSEALRPWREVLQPHEDVATGNFHAAEFAADLFKVATNDANQDRDYSDPVQFFARTYLTEGLRDLIGRAVRRLSKDENASPVINLQTNFGGGKTHSMLSLWHLAAGRPLGDFGQETQDLLQEVGYSDLPSGIRRVAIVGNHLAPTGSTKPDGTKVNTIWGELAWQLGGAEGYARVAPADRASTNPGEDLHSLIADHAPAVILIDEWVAYARQLYNREGIEGGTFDTQFTFAQSLTEAVKGTPGVLLAISIPASDNADDATPGSAEEVGGAFGLEALKRLQNVVRRVADQWRPASSDEAYHIVKRRLFVQPDAAALAAIKHTAETFGQLYQKHSDQFPLEARDLNYVDRIRATYPIHPELFDRLYQEWSTLERFQRTRGVLRLMNEVIHALWVGGDQAPLILPASIPLNTAKVNSELTQYLQDQWKAIIDADVDGDRSEPVRIDTETPLYGARSITRRLARTVFFGAAPTIGTAHKGIETQRVFLGTAIPGDTIGNFHSALNRLADRATYFYSSGGKLWYDTQANITRRAKDQGDALHVEDVWHELVDRLQKQQAQRGAFARVVVAPDDTSEILDVDEATLVIVHPKAPYAKGKESPAKDFAQRATESRGTANRQNRNMLVFLAGDRERLSEVERAARQYLGWKSVLGAKHELDLTPNQEQQAIDQKAKHDQTLADRLALAYQWVLVPAQPDPAQPFLIDVTKADGQGTSYAERVSKKLGNEGRLVTQIAPSAIRTQLDQKVAAVWASGHVSVKELWELFAKYPYMPRLRDRAVLDAGVLATQDFAWVHDGFAVAVSYDESLHRYRGLVVPQNTPSTVTDSTLLVKPGPAQEQDTADKTAAATTEVAAAGEGTAPGPGSGPVAPPAPEGPVAKKRFFGSKKITADSYAGELAKLNAEVLTHLAQGAKLSITLDVEAISEEGFTEQQVRTVSENAKTLKFDSAEFE
jgi:predicted AAA+ superfamily ATPase